MNFKGNNVLVLGMGVLAIWWFMTKKSKTTPGITPSVKQTYTTALAQKVATAVAAGKSPEGVTLTGPQLVEITSGGIEEGTPLYIAARDVVYTEVAAELQPNETVFWSAAEGFHAVETGSPEYWAAQDLPL